MIAPEAQVTTLRLSPRDRRRLAWAFGISLAVHLLCFGGYEFGKTVLPVWIQRIKFLAKLFPPNKPQEVPKPVEPPLMFVNVTPEQASPEAPKNAKYYSDKNSKAANPNASKKLDIPQINGKQTEVVKAEDTPKSPFDKLQPDFNALDKQRSEEESRAKPVTPPGDLVMAKPETNLRPDTGTQEETRPRTIREALMRQHRDQLMGEKMKQDGGTDRLRLIPSFDTKSTAFGVYDAYFIEVVQQHWYDLLDQINYVGYRSGKVELSFRLNYDGRITDMKVNDSNVGDMLSLVCQQAILEPAPYDKWSSAMRLEVGRDYRELHFVFYYN